MLEFESQRWHYFEKFVRHFLYRLLFRYFAFKAKHVKFIMNSWFQKSNDKPQFHNSMCSQQLIKFVHELYQNLKWRKKGDQNYQSIFVWKWFLLHFSSFFEVWIGLVSKDWFCFVIGIWWRVMLLCLLESSDNFAVFSCCGVGFGG